MVDKAVFLFETNKKTAIARDFFWIFKLSLNFYRWSHGRTDGDIF